MRYIPVSLATISACLAVATPALAQSLTGNVSSPNISAGDRGVESRTGMDNEGNLAGRVHYDQAFSGWYKLRFIGAYSRKDGSSVDFSGVTLENWLQWTEESSDGSGISTGATFSYTLPDGAGPDKSAFGLLLADRFAQKWEWRANASADTEVGGGRKEGVNLGSSFQLTRKLNITQAGSSNWRLGAEMFSKYGTTDDILDLDDQAHQIGPVIDGKWDNGFYLQAALRAGLTEGSDDFMGKVFIGRKF